MPLPALALLLPPPPLPFIPPPPPPLLPPTPVPAAGAPAAAGFPEVPVIPEADSLSLVAVGMLAFGTILALRSRQRRKR